MSPKICDDSQVIKAVRAYINHIKNTDKRRYADDFWAAIYDESACGRSTYPDTAAYNLRYMAIQAVQMRIRELITMHRTCWA